MASRLDINDPLFRRASLSFEPEESAEELTARLKVEAGQATSEIVKGYVLFFVILLSIVAIGGLCAWQGIFDPTASADTKRWAQTSLSALFTGSVSFVLGQMTAKRVK